jgi:hypothetical protein
MQDIGRHNASGEDGDAAAMAAIGTRLPPSIIEMVAEAEGGEVSRPDIQIAHRLDVPLEMQIHIVEVKYC